MRLLAGIARAAAVGAAAVSLLTPAAGSAAANEPEAPTGRPPPASIANRPTVSNVDAPYIWVNICVHIPTPGSATLDWCWP